MAAIKGRPFHVPDMGYTEWDAYPAEEKAKIRLKELEIAEVDSKWRNIKTMGITVVINATVIAAFLSLVGTMFRSYWDSKGRISLERESFRSELILKGMDPDDEDQSRDYLEFLREQRLVNEE
jgi:hypothetical protein